MRLVVWMGPVHSPAYFYDDSRAAVTWVTEVLGFEKVPVGKLAAVTRDRSDGSNWLNESASTC